MFEPTAAAFEVHAPEQAADLIHLAKLYRSGTVGFRAMAAQVARRILDGTEAWALWCQLANHRDD